MTKIENILGRIELETGVPGLLGILAEKLAPADLHSLLLEVFRLRARRRDAGKLVGEYSANRLVQPSPIDARTILRWDRILIALLPQGFLVLELAPFCLLGSNSVIAAMSQNKTLVTTRSLAVSDATMFSRWNVR